MRYPEPAYCIMKLFIAVTIVFTIESCNAKNNNYYTKTDAIDISNYSIPDSTGVFDTIRIGAHAEEPNGCWGNLNFVLSKTKDFEYKLKAFGTFVNNGEACPNVMVFKDTFINFSPSQAGVYFFYISNTPSTMIIDSLIVR